MMSSIDMLDEPKYNGEIALLFLDTLDHEMRCFNTDEIFFKQVVQLQLIRIVKFETNPHPTLRPCQSQSQRTSAKLFEIFGKNYDQPSDRFEVILDACNINNNPEVDTLIPLSKQFITNHIIIRGEYEKLTLALYGRLIPSEEANWLSDKQLEMRTPESRKEELSSMLTMDEEKELQSAYKDLQDPETLIYLDQALLVSEKEEEPASKKEIKDKIRGKLELQAKNNLDVYQELCGDIEKIMYEEKIHMNQPFRGKNLLLAESVLPLSLTDVCLSGFTSLEMRLCTLLSSSQLHVKILINKGVLQCLADILVNCRSQVIQCQALEAISSLVVQEEALDALQNVELSISIKPEVVIEEEVKEKNSKSESKHKHKHKKEKEKSHKNEKSKDSKKDKKKSSKKRSKSPSEVSVKSTDHKRKKVVPNSLSEILTGTSNLEIKTLYQLMLAFVAAKPPAFILKLVKNIVDKIDFLNKFKKLKEIYASYAKDQRASASIVLYLVESIYSALPQFMTNNEGQLMITNELAQVFTHYEFIYVLTSIIAVSLPDEENLYTFCAAAKALKWFIITPGGMNYLESENKSLIQLLNLNRKVKSYYKLTEDYHMNGVKDVALSFDEYITCDFLRSTGRIDFDELLSVYKNQSVKSEQKTEYIRNILLERGDSSKKIKELLLEQLADSIEWRILLKSELKKLREEPNPINLIHETKKLFETVKESSLASEAISDIFCMYEFELESTMICLQKKNVDSYLIFLMMLLELIKCQKSSRDSLLMQFPAILGVIKVTRESIENGEIPKYIEEDLKKITDNLFSWLEAYNTLAEPNSLIQVVRNCWSLLPISTSLNLPFHDPNYSKFFSQACEVAMGSISNVKPYYLGSVSDMDSPIIFLKNTYRCLTILFDHSELIESGMISHLTFVLSSLARCFLLWKLPSCSNTLLPSTSVSGGGNYVSPQLLSEDYYELVMHILKVFKRLIPRVILCTGQYKNSALLDALLHILSYAILEIYNSAFPIKCKLYTEISNIILTILSQWMKQPEFLEKELLPRIAELLVDLPEIRFCAMYLLNYIIYQCSFRESVGLDNIERFVLSSDLNSFLNQLKTLSEKTTAGDSPQEESPPSVGLSIIMKSGSLLNFILNTLYDSNDLLYLSTGITLLKTMSNLLSPIFAINLVDEIASKIKSYSQFSIRPEFESGGTPSSKHGLHSQLSKVLIIIKELMSTMAKFKIIQQCTIIDDLIEILKQLGAETMVKSPKWEEIERLILKNLEQLCCVEESLCVGRNEEQLTYYELLPTIPQMQKILSCLMLHITFDPPTFNALSNNNMKPTMIITDYLNTISAYARNSLGRSIIFFGDYYSTFPKIPKVIFCFKELIDQCIELLKAGVPSQYLSPVIVKVLDIILALSSSFESIYWDSISVNPAPGESHCIQLETMPAVIVRGLENILMGDSFSILRLQGKIKPFTNTYEIRERWSLIEKILQQGDKEITGGPTKEIPKLRPIEAIYKSYRDKKDLANKLFEVAKPKTLNMLEILYGIRTSKTYIEKSSISLFSDMMSLSFFPKQKDEWIVERIAKLDDILIHFSCDIRHSIGFVIPRISGTLNEFTEKEVLKFENGDQLMSIHVMKRKQKEENERKRGSRLKATTNISKISSYPPPIPGAMIRRPIAIGNQPSRSISTHVDVFEGLTKGSKNPFPKKKHGILPPSYVPTMSAPTIIHTDYTPRPVQHIPVSPQIYTPPPPQAESNSKVNEILKLLKIKPKTVAAPRIPGYPVISGSPVGTPTGRIQIHTPSSLAYSRIPAPVSPVEKASAMNFQSVVSAQKIQSEELLKIISRSSDPSPSSAPMADISSPTNLPPMNEHEKEVFKEIQALRQHRMNDPRTGERIHKLCQQFPKMVLYMKALIKKS